MEQVECIQLDHWVQIPGTFESPEYFPDYIAVAAEECSRSFSQGSSSPETYISTDDILDDLPNVNEDVANEIVSDMVCEDPSFGSVLIDGDISEILNVDPDGYDVTLSESFGTFPNVPVVVNGTPTRRKQRIVPKINEPFESGVSSYSTKDLVQQINSRSQKRPLGNSDVVDYVSKKKIRTVPAVQMHLQDEILETKDGIHLQFLKNESGLGSLRQTVVNEDDKQNTVVRQRKRGLNQDERKERKKQSNRNASYRYRQRKKDEMDGFYQESLRTLQTFENEKEAYQNVVEEFIRCIKHAQLVSDARYERKTTGLLLKV